MSSQLIKSMADNFKLNLAAGENIKKKLASSNNPYLIYEPDAGRKAVVNINITIEETGA